MPDNKQPYVLAIDIGSSSVKVGLYDSAAMSVEGTEVSVPHEQTVLSDGTSEERVDDIVHAVESAIDRSIMIASDLGIQVSAIGMDSMASTILGVDSNGVPVTPVYTYADTRTFEDVDLLRAELDTEAVHDRTGAMQHTSYVPGRVRWLRRTQPRTATRVARWLDVSTFLFTRWFGTQDVAASFSIASWSGMLNRRTLRWDTALLQHIGLTEKNLPRLSAHSQPQVGLCPQFAKRWPMLARLPFFPAVGDGAAVNIGSGCDSRDRVALTVGTTSAMRVIIQGESPEVPYGLWAYRLGRDATLMGGAFSEGGLLLEWAENVLKMPPLDVLDSELLKRDPDSHGLTILPFLAGERATGWSTHATGVFEGLRASTTSLDLVQAMMESVSLRFSLVAEILLPNRSPDVRFVASGGSVRRSKWWLQTMADALDAPVEVSGADQETSRGAAVLALKSLGAVKSLDSLRPRIQTTYHPRPMATSVLKAAVERQRKLYDRILG
ncbi:MAG: gluconokinase [Chloroflexi bacterium]|nr:gluconokinase [Chloroflexota bacterium]